TRLYADLTKGERVKIFRNEEFGYRRITVERPLRVRWEVTDETLELLRESKLFQKLGADGQEKMLTAVEALKGTQTTEREAFTDKVRSALASALPKSAKPLEKALIDAAAVRDPEAPIVTNKHALPEPDTELRDHENVPLSEDIDAFLRREVLATAPGAWLDKS